ncbi:MAG: hypothetical protein RR848_04130 [Oscillospiraceae bacterium]
MQFCKEYRFDRLGCFAYSEEEGTVAAQMEQMPMETREKRADIIMRIQSEIMAAKQAAKVGKTLTAVCDDYDDENDLYIMRTEQDAPEIDAECYGKSDIPLETGAFYKVEIEESDMCDLFGVVKEEI